MSNFETFIREQAEKTPCLYLSEALALYANLPHTIDFDSDPAGWAIVQPKIAEALSNSKHLQAIKELRAVQGLSLMEAKNIIDEARVRF